jgi:hypothetical protein
MTAYEARLSVKLITIWACVAFSFGAHAFKLSMGFLLECLSFSIRPESRYHCFHAVGGRLLHAGRYTVDSSVEVPLGLRKDPFHEGYQDFQMSARARQQGFLKAMTFYFERHNQSGFIVVHYAALSFVLGSFFLILNTASRKAGRKKAESSRRG